MFVHAGFSHLAGNMLFLFVFGNDVEDALGHYAFLGFYLIGGLGAHALHAAVMSLSSPAALNMPAIGASGAVSALMGLYAVRFYKTNVLVWYFIGFFYFLYVRTGTFKVKAAWFIGVYFAWQTIMGFVSLGISVPTGVAVWAHIGGALTGLAFALLIHSPKEATVEYETQDAAAAQLGGSDALAVDHWERVLRVDPTNAEANLKVGQALLHLNENDKANKHFTIAFSSLLGREDNEVAAADYEYLLLAGIKPLLPPDILFRLASACELTGRITSAAKAWADLADAQPLLPEAETALVRLAYLKERNQADLAGAREAYARYLKAYPNGQWCDLAQAALTRLADSPSSPSPATPSAPEASLPGLPGKEPPPHLSA
jgi:membrane associated rhomboid family serine protease